MPVQMRHLDRRVSAVHPHPAHLIGQQHAVHHGRQRPAREPRQRRRHVLALRVVHQPCRHRLHLLPLPEQMQQQVVLVDAVPHRRPAALGGPPSAPGHGVVRGIPVPRGLAMRHQRSAQLPAPYQLPCAQSPTPVPVLEDHRRVRPGRGLRRRDLVVLGERQAQRLLAQHPGARLQRGDGLFTVQRRRRADEHQIGPYGVQHRLHRRETRHRLPRFSPRLRAEGVQPAGVDIDGGDEFDTVGVGPQRGQMAAADDRTGADDSRTTAAGKRGHAALLGEQQAIQREARRAASAESAFPTRLTDPRPAPSPRQPLAAPAPRTGTGARAARSPRTATTPRPPRPCGSTPDTAAH